MRIAALVASTLLVGSFFLLAATDTRGYEAFWISFSAWADIRSWDGSAVPIALSWLANVGAVAAVVTTFSTSGSDRRLRWVPLLTVFALGPPLVVLDELRLGYYTWTGACLFLAFLALARSSRSRATGRRGA